MNSKSLPIWLPNKSSIVFLFPPFTEEALFTFFFGFVYRRELRVLALYKLPLYTQLKRQLAVEQKILPLRLANYGCTSLTLYGSCTVAFVAFFSLTLRIVNKRARN